LDELFHYACKAERQVQENRQVYSKSSRTYPSSSTPWKGTNQQQKSFSPSSNRGTRPAAQELSAGRSTSSVHKPTDPKKTVAARTKSLSSVASTARTREIECFKCKGKGHYMRDCQNQRALIIREDGEYTSASEAEEGKSDHEQLENTSDSGSEGITFDTSHTSLVVR
jgi:hypothetical protein